MRIQLNVNILFIICQHFYLKSRRYIDKFFCFRDIIKVHSLDILIKIGYYMLGHKNSEVKYEYKTIV